MPPLCVDDSHSPRQYANRHYVSYANPPMMALDLGLGCSPAGRGCEWTRTRRRVVRVRATYSSPAECAAGSTTTTLSNSRPLARSTSSSATVRSRTFGLYVVQCAGREDDPHLPRCDFHSLVLGGLPGRSRQPVGRRGGDDRDLAAAPYGSGRPQVGSDIGQHRRREAHDFLRHPVVDRQFEDPAFRLPPRDGCRPPAQRSLAPAGTLQAT